VAYLGNDLQVAFPTYRNIDDISGSFNGVTTSFPLTVGGVAPIPAPLNSQQCLISVNGVVQRPDDSGAEGFLLSGGNIVFASAPAGGVDFFGVILAGADYINIGANFPSGTALVPSITFDSDLDTGIYNPAGNQIGFTTAGVQRLVINSSGQVSGGLGSATTPAFSFLSDPNTGIYSPGADQVAVATNGAQRITVDSSGRLLVGTSSTRTFLSWDTPRVQIEGTGYQQSSLSLYNNENTVYGAVLALGHSRGTSLGSNTVVSQSDYFGAISFYGSDGSNELRGAEIAAYVDGTPGANDMPGRLVFLTTADGASNPTERMRIDSSGRVGIGTASPVANLQVTATGSVSEVFVNSDVSTSAVASRIALGNNVGTARFTLGLLGGGGETAFLGTEGNFPIYFQTNGTERARIDSSGRLGIGTSTPGSYNAYADDLVIANGSGNPGITLAGSATGWGSIYFADGTTGSEPYSGYIQYNHTNDRMTFATGGGLAAMHIDSSQRVGIGTSSPGTNLDVSGIIRSNDVLSDGNAGFLIATDAAARGYVGTAYWLNGGSETDLGYRVESGNNHIWMTASAERARIDGSGRLLVGTSTARSTTGFGTPRLQLVGNYESSILLTNNEANLNSVGLVLSKIRGTSIVQNEDPLGYIGFAGYDGSIDRAGAYIQANVDGTPGDGDMPTRLSFSTTADGASATTERMRINNAGTHSFFCTATTAGIMATSSGAGTSVVTFACRHSASSTTTGTNAMFVYSNGNLVNTNNSYGAISDIKLKENIVNASSQWDDLKALQVRNYNFKEGQTHTQIGLVAQEVELVSPGLVTESPDRDEDGNDLGTVTKSVNYSVLYMKAVKALQEAMERIEQLEAKVAALESA
jgi:hypothetical protein